MLGAGRWLALACGLFIAASAGAVARAQVISVETTASAEKSFGDWRVVCDDSRRCTAIGLPKASPAAPNESGALLMIEREPQALAAAKVELVFVETLAPPPAGRWTMRTVAGTRLAQTGLSWRGGDRDGRRARLPVSVIDGLTAAARESSGIVVEAGGKAAATISLGGLVDALAWMDHHQGRYGGETALLAKGSLPASAVPKPPRIWTVFQVEPPRQPSVPPDPPPRLTALAARLSREDFCARDTSPRFVGRLDAHTFLWSIFCEPAGPHGVNGAEILVLSNRDGSRMRYETGAPDGSDLKSHEAKDPPPADDTETEFDGAYEDVELLTAMNFRFDPATGVMVEGSTSTGGASAWYDISPIYSVWTGSAFQIVRSVELSTENGVPSLSAVDVWPSTTHVVVRRCPTAATTTQSLRRCPIVDPLAARHIAFP